MEVRTIGVWHNNKCPFSGNGLTVVVEKTGHDVHLFYPFTLEEWTMPTETRYDDSGNVTVEGFNQAAKDSSEYTNMPKIAGIIRNQISNCIQFGRSFPVSTVARVLAELEGKRLADVEQELGSALSANRKDSGPKREEMRLSSKIVLKKHEELVGRDAIVASAMIKLGAATVGQILEAAFANWPTRAGKPADRDKAMRHVVYITNRWISLGWAEAR